MKILAVDTSTTVMGIALMDDHKIYAETVTNLRKNHSVRLMPMMDQLFTEINWTAKEIDLIAVAQGPGSYTGVRIGVTTAKTFSWALNIPLIGISTLEAMAYQHQHYNGSISPLLDARRGQVYTGLYSGLDKWENVEEDRIIQLHEWLEQLKEKDKKVLFIGEDVFLHKDLIRDMMGEQANFTSPVFEIPRPGIIGFLAQERYEKGDRENTFDFAPAYLQLAEAEAKWLAKQKG